MQLGYGKILGGGFDKENYGFVPNGSMNKKGLYAGNNEDGNAMGVKCLLENGWGCVWQFVDDFNLGPVEKMISDNCEFYYQPIYAGQNDSRSVNDDLNNKERIAFLPLDYECANAGDAFNSGIPCYARRIHTSNKAWGFPKESSRTCFQSVGMCDAHYVNGTTGRIALVGGASKYGRVAGLNAWDLPYGASKSGWDYGARLAFAYD